MGKHIIQFFNRLFPSAHQLSQAFDIMRNKPTLLERIRLHTSITFRQPSFFGPRQESPLFILLSETAMLGIINMLIRFSQLPVMLFFGSLAQSLCQFSHTPFGISILKRRRNRTRHITILGITKQARRFLCILPSLLQIIVPYTLLIGINQYRNSRISDHTSTIGILELPTFQITFSTLIGQRNQRIEHITDHIRTNQSQEWHLAAENIPTTEDRPFLETTRLINLLVSAHILAIRIRIQTRIDHRTIQSRIENMLQLFIIRGHFHFRQRLIPSLLIGLQYPFEVPISYFGPDSHVHSLPKHKISQSYIGHFSSC